MRLIVEHLIELMVILVVLTIRFIIIYLFFFGLQRVFRFFIFMYAWRAELYVVLVSV